MNNNKFGNAMPLGLGMALSQNIDSLQYFSNLSAEEQASIIEHVRTINSKQEMKKYVESLGKEKQFE